MHQTIQPSLIYGKKKVDLPMTTVCLAQFTEILCKDWIAKSELCLVFN
jgi:hypothetical protein